MPPRDRLPGRPGVGDAGVREARRGATARRSGSGPTLPLALSGDAAIGVEVDGRVEPAGAVLVAAGPWTPALIDPTGDWQPIRSSWGVVAELDLPNAPRHVLEADRHRHRAGRRPAAEPSERAPVEGGLGFSLVTAAGASALGSTFLASRAGAGGIRGCHPRARRTLRARRSPSATVVGLRSCARPVALDGRPLVGAVPGVAGLFVAAGNGPWGISTGPATARLIADLVLGR